MTVDISHLKRKKYQTVLPEGGWGYIITLAVSLTFIVTVVPVTVFGLVFGNFLANLGDEASGTAMANGIFNTVISFTGLAANQLLQKYSCRKVGLLGAGLYFIGTFGTIFVTDLIQLIISFGVFQGMGFGLMMPASFTSFNTYFDKKKNVMMNVAQAIIVAVTIAWPVLTKFLLEMYGFRGTVAIFSAVSLHAFVAMGVLQPVKWHMKKIPILGGELESLNPSKNGSVNNIDGKSVDNESVMNKSVLRQKGATLKKRLSIVSIGSYSASIGNINHIGRSEEKELSVWQKVSKALDLGLFKDPVYVNIAFGLSFSLTSDLAFLSLLPLILINAGFNAAEITLVLTVYFTADLVSRVLFSIITAFMEVSNRYLFLAGALFSAFFRTLFILNNSVVYKACIAAALGFLRCLIQTPLPLVVAEAYSERFATAFSLYMVVCGVVSLIFGPLIGFVKTSTQSDEAVVHILTLAFLLCGVPWTIEILCKKFRGKK